MRWDSLGECLALTCAFQDLAEKYPKAGALAAALDKAVGTFLVANKNPGRKAKEVDNRGSHYWLARYWSEELAKQSVEAGMQKTFAGVAEEWQKHETDILQDLVNCQGAATDLGGYYRVGKSADETSDSAASSDEVSD